MRGATSGIITKLGCQIKHKPHAIIPLGYSGFDKQFE